MLDSIGRGLRRVGLTLALAAAVLAAVAAVVTVVPASMLPLYVGGWIAFLVAIIVKHSEVPQLRRLAERQPLHSVLATLEVVALFAFGLVTLRSFLSWIPLAVLAGLIGLLAALWDLTG